MGGGPGRWTLSRGQPGAVQREAHGAVIRPRANEALPMLCADEFTAQVMRWLVCPEFSRILRQTQRFAQAFRIFGDCCWKVAGWLFFHGSPGARRICPGGIHSDKPHRKEG